MGPGTKWSIDRWGSVNTVGSVQGSVGLGVRGGWATRFLTRIRPAEDSWPAGLARVVFGNLNENDTKQKFPRWFQGVFTETFLIVTGPYLGFL